jgi:hypothetical protein
LIDEIITSVVSSFDETHSSTGSKRNTLYQLAASNPCVHWAVTTKLRLSQTVCHKKKLNYYQEHSVSNDKTKMTEVKVNYTIFWIKCCKGTYS